MLKKLAIVLASLLLQLHPASAQGLRDSLEAAYKRFASALAGGDMEVVRANMGASDYADLRNFINARRTPLDEFFETAPSRLPKLAELQFLTAHRKGQTAAATYLQALPEDSTFAIIYFVNEGGGWKFSNMIFQSLSWKMEQLAAGDLSFLDDKEFLPPGEIAPPSPIYPVPEYAAEISIYSYTYKTYCTINGIEQDATGDSQSKSLVMGGLKRGSNTIELRFEPNNPHPIPDIEVKVYALDADGIQHEVFSYKPPKKVPAKLVRKFTVTDKTFSR